MYLLAHQRRNNNSHEFFWAIQGTEKAWGTKCSERQLFIGCPDAALRGVFVRNRLTYTITSTYIRPSRHPDITLSDIRNLLSLALWVEHDLTKWKITVLGLNSFIFECVVRKWNSYLCIMWYICFVENSRSLTKTKECDQL